MSTTVEVLSVHEGRDLINRQARALSDAATTIEALAQRLPVAERAAHMRHVTVLRSQVAEGSAVVDRISIALNNVQHGRHPLTGLETGLASEGRPAALSRTPAPGRRLIVGASIALPSDRGGSR